MKLVGMCGYPCVCIQKTQPPLFCFCPLMLFVSALFNPLWMVDSSAHLSVQARLKVHRQCRGRTLQWLSIKPEKSNVLFMNHSAIDNAHPGKGWSTQGARNTGGHTRNLSVGWGCYSRLYFTINMVIPLSHHQLCQRVRHKSETRLFFMLCYLMQIR